MEILFIALTITQIVATAIYGYAIKKKIQKRYENISNFNYIRHQEMMSSIEKLNRTLLARDDLQPKPIKPNNWDSVKGCFQSPSRKDLNVGN